MPHGGCVISKSAADAFSGVVGRSLALDPIDKKYLINQARNLLTARAQKTAPVKTPVVSATSLKTLEDSGADMVGATRLEPTGGNCLARRAAPGVDLPFPAKAHIRSPRHDYCIRHYASRPTQLALCHEKVRSGEEDSRRHLGVARAGARAFAFLLRPAALPLHRRHRSGASRRRSNRSRGTSRR